MTVIEPQKAWVSLNLRELLRYRDLLTLLVWRDFSARYRQSVLGVGWAIVNPLVQLVIYTVVFGSLARLPSDGVPYPVFNFAGLLPWLYFSTCLTQASNSTVSGSALITKVYFPRLILPLATVVNGLIDFAIQLVLLVLLMAIYGVWPTWGVVFLGVDRNVGNSNSIV